MRRQVTARQPAAWGGRYVNELNCTAKSPCQANLFYSTGLPLRGGVLVSAVPQFSAAKQSFYWKQVYRQARAKSRTTGWPLLGIVTVVRVLSGVRN